MSCSNPVDDSANTLPYQSELDGSAEGGDSVSAGDCDCLQPGMVYIFDTLEILTIDGEASPVIGTLNALWGNDIANTELNILFEVTDVTATSVTLNAVNGPRIDGTTDQVCILRPSATPITFPRKGCQLQLTDESNFNVYAGTPTFPKNCAPNLPVKHAIPVERAKLEATISPSCERLNDGHVPSGSFAQEALGKVCACLTPPLESAEFCQQPDPGYAHDICGGCNEKFTGLKPLLEAFGGVTWSCETSAGEPAACLTANFEAALLPASLPDCSEVQ